MNILRVDSSAQKTGSASRKLGDYLLRNLAIKAEQLRVVSRDLADGIPLIDEAWVAAKAKRPDALDDRDKRILALSDQLIDELEAADVIVIGAPVYNFGPSAALKAWIDLVARPGRTFNYTSDGPVGLLKNKKVYVLMASGGTELGSPIDFLSGYLRHVLAFIGLDEVEFIAADKLMSDPKRLSSAENHIKDLLMAA